MKKFIFFLVLASIQFISIELLAQNNVVTGAANTSAYMNLLKGKRVGVFANQTSTVGNQHLIDVLMSNGVNLKKIFGPEHGFRGAADAGEKVGNYVDEKTGVPVISLYGSKHKPSKEDLDDVDVLIFDIQDVGVRFYTFISSLQEFMEAAFLHQKSLIVLDRPNPNADYVDGPVLDTAFKSFVGMQPVPVVYGMTIGEYATMLVGENWLNKDASLGYEKMKANGMVPLKVIPCSNYTRSTVVPLRVKPSPNLPDMTSVYWYPSICFFEGTVLSEGRGTATPFQVFGHPQLPTNLYAFTPKSMPGATNPKLKDQLCYGWTLVSTPEEARKNINGKIHLEYLLEAYKLFPDKNSFFILPASGNSRGAFFNKLAGNDQLMKQIQQGMDIQAIRKSWEPGLTAFKQIRQKYLLYQ